MHAPCSRSLEYCFLGLVILQVITPLQLNNKEHVELILLGICLTITPDFTTLTANGLYTLPTLYWQASVSPRNGNHLS